MDKRLKMDNIWGERERESDKKVEFIPGLVI